MNRKIITLVIVIVMVSVVLAFVYEDRIISVVPSFSASLYLSAIIFLFGIIYGMLMRNMMLAVIGVAGALIIPKAIRLFIYYFPYVLREITR